MIVCIEMCIENVQKGVHDSVLRGVWEILCCFHAVKDIANAAMRKCSKRGNSLPGHVLHSY